MTSNLDHTIKRVETIPVSLPLIKPVLMGDNQDIRSSDSLLVRLETVGGVIGWGEASAAPKMTGETLLGMKQLVDTQFSQMLVGQSIVDWAMVNDQIQNGIPGNTGAKAACNIALYDLYGKCFNISVSDLLGGRIRRQIPVMTLLANPTIQEDLLDSVRYYQAGIRFFKLKIGVKSIEEEIATLNELRRLYGSAVFLSADANAGLCLADAKLILQGIAQSNLLFFEQALASDDLDGSVQLAQLQHAPLCADESAHDIAHIIRWHEHGAIAGVNLKTIKFGGVGGVSTAAKVAHALGLEVNLASKAGESSLGTSALIHLAYTVPSINWGVTPSCQYLQEDIVEQKIVIENGSVICPTGPGLGVDINEKMVNKYRIEHLS